MCLQSIITDFNALKLKAQSNAFILKLSQSCYFVTAEEKITMTAVGTRKWATAVARQIMLLGEKCGRIWEFGLEKQLNAVSRA